MSPSASRSRLEPEEAIQGAILWQLLEDLYDSVHRRVEAVRILDDNTARRRVTIDFAVESSWSPAALRRLPGVPLTYLKKEPLRRFDLRDGEGRALPVLTKRQNGALVGHAMVYTLESFLSKTQLSLPLPDMVERTVRSIVEGDPPEADSSLRRILEGGQLGSSDAFNPYWAEILKSESLTNALTTLAGNFVLMVVCEPAPGQRRIFKMEFDEPLAHKNRTRLAASTGWAPEVLTFEAPGVALARSYHLEIAAPQHLRIVGAPLTVTRSDGGAGQPEEFSPLQPVVREAHYYLSGSRPRTVGRADLALKAETGGIVLVARVLAVFVALLLGAGLARLDEVANSNRSQVTAAVLLVAPALISIVVVRPDENELASRMLFGLRALLFLNTMSAVLAAALLAAGLSSHDLQLYWEAAFALAVSTALALVLPLAPEAKRLHN